MAVDITDLKESNEFLNLLMDSIPSAVFLVDKSVRIQQFNQGFKKLFSKPEEEILNEFCGNAIGCAFTVDENGVCGHTSNCDKCELRDSIIMSFAEKAPSLKVKLTRDFYIGGQRLNKHFLFSSLYLTYHGDEMILIVVDDMTELETQRLSLVEKQERLDEDLKSAAEIQKSLLPASLPKLPGCDFAFRFIPSERVGGDIFNIFELDDERVVIYILDVSGHGVPAAMVTVSVSQMLSPTTGYFCNRENNSQFVCETELSSPKMVLTALDIHYPIERFDKYFTMSYVVLNHRKASLVSCNAGHPTPILLRSDGHVEYLEEGGAIVGLGGLIPYEDEMRLIEKGDKLIFYTDGITEYSNSAGELFGERRLKDLLGPMVNRTAEDTAEEIIRRIMEFGDGSPPGDDITLVVAHFS
ncbi:MAG: SpoIIE family protein phosphatase [Desulfomonilaceae bacterium]